MTHGGLRGSALPLPCLPLPCGPPLRHSRPAWRFLALTGLAAMLLVSAPAEVKAREPVISLQEKRQANVIIQQWDISCGAAALATVLTYQFDDPISEREIATSLMSREEYLADPQIVRARMGFSLLDLKRFVDARGYSGAGYGHLELGQLVEMAPVIVPVKLLGYRHFVVFRGMQGDRVLLADPGFGNRTMPIERFERAWIDDQKLGRIGFVVTRPGTVPQPHRLTPREGDFAMVR